MGVKKKCPEFENHERWLVSYADMVTLLFAVFVVLYALSTAGNEKKEQEQVTGSIQESFNTPLEEIPYNRRTAPSEAGWGIFENMRGNQVRPSLIQKYPSSSVPVKVINDDFAKVTKEIEERLYGDKKFRDSESLGLERIVSIHRNAKGFKLRLLARHFYTSGGVAVKRSALRDLDNVIAIIKGLNRPITIEGHTDNIPPQGEYTNWELSSLRAAFVAKYMIRESNFPVSMLSIAGYADTKPISHNGTEAGRSLNRRIEFQVHYDSEYDEDLPSGQ